MYTQIYHQPALHKEGAWRKGQDDAETVLAEKPRSDLRKPNMYRVVMLDDDYTPMDFVVRVLEIFFGMDSDTAIRTMLKVHTEGRAICGVYTRDVAETKAEQVRQYAFHNEHPLLCTIEAEEDGERG